MFKTLFILGLSFTSLLSFGQNQLKDMELFITSSFRTFYTIEPDLRSYMRPHLEQRMVDFISDSSSFNYQADSLKQYVNILNSTDRRIKIYSFDKLSGKVSDDFSYAQYQTSEGEIKSQKIATTRISGNGAVIKELYTVNINGNRCYLTIAEGVNDVRSHKLAQVYYLDGESLEAVDSVFNGVSLLYATGQNLMNTILDYNPDKQTLSFTDVYDSAKKVVVLKLINGRFRPLPQE